MQDYQTESQNQDFATYVDEVNNNFPASDEQIPDLLSERPDRIANRRAHEKRQPMEAGQLFHGYVDSVELRMAANGNPFLSFKCHLFCNNWRRTSAWFLPRNRINSTEQIADCCAEYLAKLGYQKGAQNEFPHTLAFQLGSWTSDSDKKTHLKIDRILRDTKDYNSYVRWKWRKDQQKQPYQAPKVELPQL